MDAREYEEGGEVEYAARKVMKRKKMQMERTTVIGYGHGGDARPFDDRHVYQLGKRGFWGQMITSA